MTKSTLHATGWISLPVEPRYERIAQQIRQERDRRYANIFEEHSTDLRWVGDLGEMVFKSWLKVNYVEGFQWVLEDVSNQPDFVLSCGHRIGVKTVKRKGAPKPHYEAGMTSRHMNEPVDSFFFLSYDFAARQMWLIGGISSQAFTEQSRHFGAGDYVHPNYCIRQGHEINNIEMAKLEAPCDWLLGVLGEEGAAQVA
jgi:hypothetical protein